MTSTIRRPGVRAARAGFLAAPFVGLAVAVALVWQSSYAAFTATTDNGVNNWTTGSVALTDTDEGSVMFNVSGLKPGSTDFKCIRVNKTGDLDGTVKLYGTDRTTPTNTLPTYLDIRVEQGTGAVTGGSCSNFVAGGTVYNSTLDGFTASSFATGYDNWAVAAGNQSRTYRFTYTLRTDAPNSTQGLSTGIRFVWEAQSGA